MNLECEKITDRFEEDCKAFFFEQTTGNLWPYLYSEPQNENDPVRGSVLYNEMLRKEKDYYLYSNESELLHNSGAQIASLIGPDATIVEMGPGGEKSFRDKTLPFLNTFTHLQGYVGVDICQGFLETILEIVRVSFPGLFVTGFHQDFSRLENLPVFAKSVIFFKGSTVGNLRDGEVRDLMSKFRRLISEGHYLVIVNDANQDEVSLMKAYDNPGVAAFTENIMYRVKRDLELSEMMPDAFRYQPEWKKESYDFRHILVATSGQKFHLRGRDVEIEKGQKLHILSSFKYPAEVFQEMVRPAGFEPVTVLPDASERMTVHLFRAV
ncbi:MAG: L-histidine N(alpha)-methyltransferase [Desulfococcaceae bacterium]|jgi:uncharacterized SAM-dependent methyltransferase|nr:L-histidine N(alpha)-methyltransferase [Desulfococcaceae bacterium]